MDDAWTTDGLGSLHERNSRPRGQAEAALRTIAVATAA